MKSASVGFASAYAGQRLSGAFIKKYLNHTQTDNTQNDTHFLKDPVLISSLSTMIMMASPIPILSLRGIGGSFVTSMVFGAWANFSKNKPTDLNKPANSSDNDSQPLKQNTAETLPPKLPDDLKKLRKQNGNPKEDDYYKFRQIELSKQWHGLDDESNVAYSMFTREMAIDNSKLDFDVELTAKFATQYYSVYKSLTTTGQENLKKNTQYHIKSVTALAYHNAYDNPLEKKKKILLACKDAYKSLLSKDNLKNSTKKLHDPLHELLEDFLKNSAIRQLSNSDTK